MSDDCSVRVLISRRKCQLVRAREEKAAYRVRVDSERCLGESCGCNRLCTRVFQCPGLAWDSTGGVARIDEVVCSGCCVRARIWPPPRISRETQYGPLIPEGGPHVIVGLEPLETLRVLAQYGNPEVIVIANSRPVPPL